MKKNILLAVDSYKYSHSKGWDIENEHQGQYPPGTESMMSYIEARSGDKTLFFGLQIFIKEYLQVPFTIEDINEAELISAAHGDPFNREGWEYVLNTYNGYMPVVIKAVPEGTIVPCRNVLATIECSDPKCFWVTSFLETALLRSIWYPTTVATTSYECREVIKHFLEETGTPESINFKLHDFGARGVSSSESASIGGLAHLATGFMGSDTMEAIQYAYRYYGATGSPSFSIPASEHSTITSWRKNNEKSAYRNIINQFGGQGKNNEMPVL